MAVFQQLCVILLIYFLLKKSKTTAAAEYAVAVLAVDIWLCQLQNDDVLFHCLFIAVVCTAVVNIGFQLLLTLPCCRSKIHHIDAKYYYVQSFYS
jgi:hypothetical protein